MSHSDQAIPEQQKEEFFQEMRDSDAYKLGYLSSAVRTAIWFLELGKTEQALENLKATATLMKVNYDR